MLCPHLQPLRSPSQGVDERITKWLRELQIVFNDVSYLVSNEHPLRKVCRLIGGDGDQGDWNGSQPCSNSANSRMFPVASSSSYALSRELAYGLHCGLRNTSGGSQSFRVATAPLSAARLRAGR